MHDGRGVDPADREALSRELASAAQAWFGAVFERRRNDESSYPTLARVVKNVLGQPEWDRGANYAARKVVLFAICMLTNSMTGRPPERPLGVGMSEWRDKPDRDMAKILFGFRDKDVPNLAKARSKSSFQEKDIYDLYYYENAIKIADFEDKSSSSKTRMLMVIRQDIALHLLQMENSPPPELLRLHIDGDRLIDRSPSVGSPSLSPQNTKMIEALQVRHEPRSEVIAVPGASVNKALPVREVSLTGHAKELHSIVLKRCSNERAILRLDDYRPMPVRWTLSADELSDGLQYVFGQQEPFKFSARSDDWCDLADQFMALDRQRMVVLGEAGAGKTVLAEALQWELLKSERIKTLIPIIVRAGNWDVQTFGSLREWLIEQLLLEYPGVFGTGHQRRSIANSLVDGNLILPIVDGLDEADPRTVQDILVALNEHISDIDPLVLTCRTDRYKQISDKFGKIRCTVTLEANPLTTNEAADYLEHKADGETWHPVLDSIRRGDSPPLADLSTNPLGLWLIRTIYIDYAIAGKRIAESPDPRELLDEGFPDAEALKQHLFDCLIPTVLARRRPLTSNQEEDNDQANPRRPFRKWSADDADRWLTYIAWIVNPYPYVDDWLPYKTEIQWWELHRSYSRSLRPRFHGSNPKPGLALVLVSLAVIAGSLGLLVANNAWYSLAFVLTAVIGLPAVAVTTILHPPEPARTVPKSLRPFIIYEIKREFGGLKSLLWLPVVGGAIGVIVFLRGDSALPNWVDHAEWFTSIASMPTPADLAISALIGATVTTIGIAAITLPMAAFTGFFNWLHPKGHVENCHRCGIEERRPIDGLPPWDKELERCRHCGWQCDCPSCEAGRSVTQSWRNPVAVYEDSRKRALRYTMAYISGAEIVMGCILWLLMLIYGQGAGSHSAAEMAVLLPACLIFIAPFAVLVGLGVAIAREPAWFGYFFVSKWLALRGVLPYKTIDFLEDIHRVGLFRLSGASYEFRHVDLQIYLSRRLWQTRDR